MKRKGGRVLKVALLAVDAGAVESDGGKAKRPGLFMGVLRGGQMFIGGRVLKVAILAVDAGAVESDGGKAKRPGVFMGVLRGGQMFMEVDQSSVDKL